MESYLGHIASVGDALKLIEAARTGVIPIFRQRLNDTERCMIRSGTVFIFDNSKVQRWTDGLQWTASRVSGHFLTYNQKNCNGRRLVKKALSVVTADNKRFGLVSYYHPDEFGSKLPSNDPFLYEQTIPKNYYFRRISQLSHDAKNSFVLAPLNDDTFSVVNPNSASPRSCDLTFSSSSRRDRSNSPLPPISLCIGQSNYQPYSITPHPYRLPPMILNNQPFKPYMTEDQRQLQRINISL